MINWPLKMSKFTNPVNIKIKLMVTDKVSFNTQTHIHKISLFMHVFFKLYNNFYIICQFTHFQWEKKHHHPNKFNTIIHCIIKTKLKLTNY